MTIEAVLFDYSGVLTTPLDMPTEDVPYDPEALLIEMIAALSSQADHPWHALERGEISLAAFMEFVESRVPGGSVLFAADSEHNVMGALQLLDDRLVLAAALKSQGMRLGVVTNNVAEWEPLWLPRLPKDLFEVVIDSAAVGCRKPEAAIYELALERLEIEAAENVLFIDDFEWNVTGALDIGMNAIHCTPATDLAAEVARALEDGAQAKVHGGQE